MPLIIIITGILLLFILISYFKISAFLSLLVTSFAVGLLNGMAPVKILESITSGFGSTMGSLALVIVFGAMLGKLLEESGAAYQITHKLVNLFGLGKIQIAIMITAFLVGLPLIYNAGFLVLIPLIYALAASTKLPLIYLGLPFCAALSVTHGFLPPHPAPTSVAFIFHADVNRTLLYGIFVAIPAIIIAGPLLSRFYTKWKLTPPAELFIDREFKKDELPSLAASLVTALSPIFLMLSGAIILMTVPAESSNGKLLKFISDPTIALFFAVFIGVYLLGIRKKRSMSELMKTLSTAVSGIAMILLIIASGGSFKQVLLDSGTADYIKVIAQGFNLSPLVLTWLVASLIRFSVGSATVACITAAGLTMPLIAGTGVSPELMVIATGAGSLMFSHFNDTGFWMFKEYFNATIKQTFAVWTVMEMLIGITGLAGVLIMNQLI
jgi:Gnt-I system high-affinity gluconate transporter